MFKYFEATVKEKTYRIFFYLANNFWFQRMVLNSLILLIKCPFRVTEFPLSGFDTKS